MPTPEVTEARARQRRINPWLIAVAVLSVALVALGAWTIVDHQKNRPQGLASDKVRAVLEDRISTLNAEGGIAVATFYSDNAVLEEHDLEPTVVTKESAHIGPRLNDMWNFGLRLKRESIPIQVGRYAAEALSQAGGRAVWICVYELDANGKITHQWVVGGE